jgi:hypothetical protein
MRLIPILAAAAIGLFATAAVAQSTNTADPNSAPKASATGGKPSGALNKANTADPNSAPGASSAGGKGKMTTGQAADPAAKANTADPNSTPGTAMKKMSKKHAKHSKKMMKKEM